MSRLIVRAMVNPEVDGRTITGLCVPFNRPTPVQDPGKPPYREQFVAGAFHRAVANPANVVLRLSHGRDEILAAGRGMLFREEADGLYGDFVADANPIGDALLALATNTDTALGLSVGIVPLREENRGGVVTRTLAHLDHVAATNSPAYKEARVLAVREDGQPKTLGYWLAKYGDLIHT